MGNYNIGSFLTKKCIKRNQKENLFEYDELFYGEHMEKIPCSSVTCNYLSVLKQILIVNLQNINIQNTIVKDGYQTWIYRK